MQAPITAITSWLAAINDFHHIGKNGFNLELGLP
jgi:hypothetical protein